MPLTIESVTIPFSEVERVKSLEHDLENRTQALAAKDEAITGLTTERDKLVNDLDTERRALAAMTARIQSQTAELENLRAENSTLKNPLPNTRRKPIITRQEFRNVAGVTAENGLVSPTEDQYDKMRLFFMLISGTGFNVTRFFMGTTEVKKHLALPETNIGHLPGFARSLGLTPGADTVDRVILDTITAENAATDPKVKAQHAANLEAYLKGIDKLFDFACFNDADKYLKSEYPAKTLETMVGRFRAVLPDKPLIASVTGIVNVADFKPKLFDHVEAQTFGTASEFKTFMARSFDAYCLDGRKTATKAYLREISPLFLAKNPQAFFFYPTTVSDWGAMPGQLTVIREMVSKWWGMRA